MTDDSLASAVIEIIRKGASGGSGFGSTEFDSIAVAIASCQGFVKKPGLEVPGNSGLDLIIPLPETTFKTRTIVQFPETEAEAEFLTSGTTSGTPGRLLVHRMSVYRDSALNGFKHFCMYGRPPRRFLSLIPGGHDRPASSLSWMASFILEEFDSEGGIFASHGQDLLGNQILETFRKVIRDDEPLFLLGTSLDFLTLFAFLRGVGEITRLPEGSRIMHTGGPKASGREITQSQLAGEAGLLFGIEHLDVIEEFGMTELFSQAYDSPRVTSGPRRLVNVPWMKTRVLDPKTMLDVKDGERGILVHYDLAAFDTCVAIMAQDTAVRINDGFASVKRALGAAPRGCSSKAARETTNTD